MTKAPTARSYCSGSCCPNLISALFCLKLLLYLTQLFFDEMPFSNLIDGVEQHSTPKVLVHHSFLGPSPRDTAYVVLTPVEGDIVEVSGVCLKELEIFLRFCLFFGHYFHQLTYRVFIENGCR